jgi:hypothetical protein
MSNERAKTTRLFHKDVFMPDDVQDLVRAYESNMKSYRLSAHLQNHIAYQAQANRSHTYFEDVLIRCLDSIKDNPQDAFEVELGKDLSIFGDDGWYITKYCVRVHYSDTEDACIAIRPQYSDGYVVGNLIVTAWMNSRNDSHFTLDKSKYCSEGEWRKLTS